MKVLLHSNAPWSPSGYGQQVALFAPRLARRVDLSLSAFHGLQGGRLRWHDIEVLPSVGDVSKREDVRGAIAMATDSWGPLDVLVAQAGIAGVVALDEITDEAWSKLIDVNLGGVFLSVQEAARAMRDGGAIVITASTNAFFPEAHTAHYSATKGGILAFAKGAALDLAASASTSSIRGSSEPG